MLMLYSILVGAGRRLDCYSPRPGIMPDSFKVRTVPLDGSNDAFEEVLYLTLESQQLGV